MPRTLKVNPYRKTDSYKYGHFRFIPRGTTNMMYYYEARGGEYPYTIPFGFQYIMKSHLEGQFGSAEELENAFDISNQHFGTPRMFNLNGWKHILNDHGGLLPLHIRAVKEGTKVGVKNVILMMEPTCERCVWLPGWTETIMEHGWFGSGVATRSHMTKELIKEFLLDTADDLSTLPYQLHDFGGRGVTCVEQMAIGSAAHMLNFAGTDTMPGFDLIQQFYDEGVSDWKVPAFSVAASEHSVTTLWGRERESDFVANALEEFPEGILSLVGDSYDIFNFTANIIGGDHRDKIRNRKGKVVVRPDSGNPKQITLEVMNILGEKFGIRETRNGYKLLPPCVGVLWGDGIDYYGVREILQTLKDNKWSAANIVFGMGGGLLQKLNRDTQKVAIKCCHAIVNGEQRDIFKDPITDPGKASKRGRLALIQDANGDYRTVSYKSDSNDYPLDQLETVFLNGEVKRSQTFANVRSQLGF